MSSNWAGLAVIDHHTREIQKQLMLGDPRPGDRFSLSNMIRGMAKESVTGYERSVLEATAGLAGKSYDPQRATVPWGVLFQQRDLAVGTSSSGGYLVGTEVTNPTDILRGFSVVADSGITIIPGLSAMVSVPRVTTAPTTMVLADEQTAITESTAAPVFGVSNLQPKNLGCYVEMSRSLLLQSPIAERYARTILLGALGAFFDKQILQGVGSNGELLGLFNVSGLGTSAGTSISQSGVTTMAQKSSEAGVRDGELTFISTPAVRQLLQIREKASGNGGFVWQNDRVADRPAYASNECPSASMVCGPWPRAIVGMWGPGPVVEINPYAGFQQGIVGMRVILSADWSPVFPGAFTKSTSIT